MTETPVKPDSAREDLEPLGWIEVLQGDTSIRGLRPIIDNVPGAFVALDSFRSRANIDKSRVGELFDMVPPPPVKRATDHRESGRLRD